LTSDGDSVGNFGFEFIDVSSILIYWVEKALCHIVPVIIAGSVDEVNAWRGISRTFNNRSTSNIEYVGIRKLESGVPDCQDSGLSVCLHSFLTRYYEKSMIVTDL